MHTSFCLEPETRSIPTASVRGGSEGRASATRGSRWRGGSPFPRWETCSLPSREREWWRSYWAGPGSSGPFPVPRTLFFSFFTKASTAFSAHFSSSLTLFPAKKSLHSWTCEGKQTCHVHDGAVHTPLWRRNTESPKRRKDSERLHFIYIRFSLASSRRSWKVEMTIPGVSKRNPKQAPRKEKGEKMFKIISTTKSQFIKQLPWARYYFKRYVLQCAMELTMHPPTPKLILKPQWLYLEVEPGAFKGSN